MVGVQGWWKSRGGWVKGVVGSGVVGSRGGGSLGLVRYRGGGVKGWSRYRCCGVKG